jgi:NADPH:quinone reductase-like Zn-dependent oxidoreductase
MRAVVNPRAGGPEELRVAEVERPEPIPTEVLVRQRAAGVNPVDWKVRRGNSYRAMLGPPPVILGWDVAGVVEEVGGGVTRFAPGDRVFGMPRFPRAARAYADYATSASRQLARIPDGMSFAEAGGLPLAGLTAWQSLVETAGVGPGNRVLIHAGAGGVGHLAVQIGKARGAEVVATVRARNHGFLAGLGADEAIDYTETDFADAVSGLDVVLDLVGGEDYGLRSLATLREGGLLIVVPGVVAEAVAAAAREQGKRVTSILVEPDRAGLEALAALYEEGRLRVEVAEAIPLADARRAHELGEAGGLRGKLVLTPDSD